MIRDQMHGYALLLIASLLRIFCSNVPCEGMEKFTRPTTVLFRGT